MKNDTEEQAEILDLDSHKVQTHRYEDEYNMRMHQHAELHHHMQMQQHHHQQQQQQMQQHHQARSPIHPINALSRPHSMAPSFEYHSSMSPMGPVDNMSSMQDQQSQFMLGQLPLAGVEPPRHSGSPIISSSQPMPNHPMHQPPASLMPAQNPKPPPMGGNQSWKSNEARRPKTYNCTACNKWFTSSGHLKRHYNTTLHKNAVKQSNQPDPANMPISAHHHPARDAATGARGSGPTAGGGLANRTSPELSSSSSPPNLMAGPSGEATRGLLQAPTTTTTTTIMYNNNNNHNNSNHHHHIGSSNSSSEATPPLQALQEQKLLQQQLHQQQQIQQQHHHHRHQPQSSGLVMASDLYQDTSAQTGMMGMHPHHQPQVPVSHQHQSPHHPPMGSPSPHQPQQQQSQMQQPQQPHLLQMGSPHPVTSSPMSPMQHHPAHMSSPSPMGTGGLPPPPPPPQHQSAHLSQQHTQQHMNSPSPTTPAAVHSAHQATSPPPPGSMMGGTTMPHQPYPNALPPHVTTITNIPGLLRSITSPLTTTGNDELQQHDHALLPAFDTFASHHHHHHHQQHLHHDGEREYEHKPKQPLSSFTQFGYVVAQHPVASQQINVGGLSPEEAHIPPQIKFEAVDRYSKYENYENYQESPPRFECLGGSDNDVEMMQAPADSSSIVSTSYSYLQQRDDTSQQYYHEQQQHHHHQQQQQQQQQQQPQRETNNNNLLLSAAKEELNPNILSSGKKRARISKASSKVIKLEIKEHQVTSTNTGSRYISENGLHKCIECDKVFNKACYLTQHNKSFHSGDKPFKCNQCGKRFPHEYQHSEHLQKHAGDKPYKCEVCPKQFNHKTDLRRHMCLHTGEKPYACDNCGKGFIRKDHMMKHVETHKKKNNLHKIHLRA